MSFDKPQDLESIQTPETKVKDGVNFVFEQNPELTGIGTKEQYSQYLDSIFPDSKDKNIWYHGTNSSPTEIIEFKPSSNGSLGPGVYLQSKQGKYHTGTFGDNTIVAIVNLKKIFDFNKDGKKLIDKLKEEYKSMGGLGDKTMIALQNTIRKDGYDSIIDIVGNGAGSVEHLAVLNPNPYVVFGPTNTRILGSKSDMEKFKDFVSKNKE